MSSDDQPAAGPPLTFGHVSRATTPPPRTHPRSRTSHTGSALLELPTMPQSIDPHLELLPTERPNLERFIATAYDFASVPLTDGPLLSPDIPPDALTGSRGPSDYDLNLSEEDTLNTVVYLSDLVSRFLPEIEPHLTRIKLNTAQLEHLEFIHRIFSYFRCKDNPSFIGSEKDTRRSFYNILGQPTQALLRAMLHSKVPKDDTPDLQKLHFVSAAHGDVITDEIWVYDRARVVNELKTPRVCSPGGVSIFNSIQSQNEKAFKFRWVVGSGRRLTNLTKVLMQLWSQLQFNNTQYGIVSDVETITFFYRKQRTLYVSMTYELSSSSTLGCLLAWVSVGCHLPGLTTSSIADLPEGDKSWWNQLPDVDDDTPGLQLKAQNDVIEAA